MPKLKRLFRVMLEGCNLLLDFDGIGQFGYITTRFVEAVDADAAAAKAIEIVEQDLVELLQNDATNPAHHNVIEVTIVVAEREISIPGEGFSFFRE